MVSCLTGAADKSGSPVAERIPRHTYPSDRAVSPGGPTPAQACSGGRCQWLSSPVTATGVTPPTAHLLNHRRRRRRHLRCSRRQHRRKCDRRPQRRYEYSRYLAASVSGSSPVPKYHTGDRPPERLRDWRTAQRRNRSARRCRCARDFPGTPQTTREGCCARC